MVEGQLYELSDLSYMFVAASDGIAIHNHYVRFFVFALDGATIWTVCVEDKFGMPV